MARRDGAAQYLFGEAVVGVPTEQEIDAALENFNRVIANYSNQSNNKFSIGISRELLRSYSDFFPTDRILKSESVKLSGGRVAQVRLHSFRCIKCMPTQGDGFYRAAADEVAELFYEEAAKHPDSEFWFYQPAMYSGVIIDPATFEPRIAIRSRYAIVPKRRF